MEGMMIDRHTMTTADVARVLDLSAERVRQLDEELEPVRTGGRGGYRRYDPAVVARVAEERAHNVRPGR